MSHICAKDGYRSQAGVQTDRKTLSFVTLVSSLSTYSSRRFQFSFTDFSLVYRSTFAEIFPGSQPMRESNTLPQHHNEPRECDII
jgi:hypothetical protein